MKTGSHPQNAPTADRARVITTAVIRAADRLQVTGRELAAILGVSAPTVTRMRRQQYLLEPGSKPFELGALFVRFFRSLDAITGGDAAVCSAWLRNDNTTLGGLPLERLKTIAGLTDVVAYLDARRAPL